jgi:hypothetical protein
VKLTDANLVFSWLWILFGFLSGLAMGLFFHRENWLGGYTSFRRRLYRLGHISFFGLGAVNLMFYLTARFALEPSVVRDYASIAFIIGGLAMPLVCLIVAHRQNWKNLFAIPVLSLVSAGVLTLWAILL